MITITIPEIVKKKVKLNAGNFNKYTASLGRKIEFCPNINISRANNINNQFIAALHHAFDNHNSFTLNPNDIWIILLSNISTHIKVNSEKFRNIFVDFEGKKELEIIDDSLVRGSEDNKWDLTFKQFKNKIQENLKVDIVDKLVPNFTNTTDIDDLCFNVGLMDSFSTYFDYSVRTRCGIPEIIIEGEIKDWELIKTNLKNITSLIELEKWYDKVEEIIDKVIEAYSNPDLEYFKSIYKYNSQSGGDTVSGWIIDLFCYIKNSYDLIVLNIDKEKISTNSFISSLFSVDFKWKYLSEKYNMVLNSGIVGFNVENDSIKPVKSYFIQYK